MTCAGSSAGCPVPYVSCFVPGGRTCNQQVVSVSPCAISPTGIWYPTILRCCCCGVVQVTGEVGPTLLFGVTAGDGTMSSISSKTTAWVQQAVAAAQSSTSASGAGLADQPIKFASSSSSSRGSSVQASARWKQSEQQVADWSRASAASEGGCGTGAAAAAGSGCGSSTAISPAATRQLIINAGWGRVELKAMGWMDGLKARMQAKQGRSQS
jgi:hypothetical protein